MTRDKKRCARNDSRGGGDGRLVMTCDMREAYNVCGRNLIFRFGGGGEDGVAFFFEFA